MPRRGRVGNGDGHDDAHSPRLHESSRAGVPTAPRRTWSYLFVFLLGALAYWSISGSMTAPVVYTIEDEPEIKKTNLRSSSVPSRKQPLSKEHEVSASRRGVPLSSARTFYTKPFASKLAAALTTRGWRRSTEPDEAEVLWYQQKTNIDWEDVKKWQRVNHVKSERQIGHKGELLEHLRGTAAMRYQSDSYALWLPADEKAFVERVLSEKPMGKDEPPRWMLKEPSIDGGKGIQVERDCLKCVDGGRVISSERVKIAQRYVPNLLLFKGHKFDIRCYWVVANLRPALVLYHPGTLRVSLANYSASSNARDLHLTNAAQQAGGHSTQASEEARQPMRALWEFLESEHKPTWPQNAEAHLECAIRRALQEIWRSYATSDVFRPTGVNTGNFVLFGADFMVTEDLDLYLTEVQSGPGLPDNTIAVREIMEKLIPSIADILDTGEAPTASTLPPWSDFEVIVDDDSKEHYPTPASCKQIDDTQAAAP